MVNILLSSIIYFNVRTFHNIKLLNNNPNYSTDKPEKKHQRITNLKNNS